MRRLAIPRELPLELQLSPGVLESTPPGDSPGGDTSSAPLGGVAGPRSLRLLGRDPSKDTLLTGESDAWNSLKHRHTDRISWKNVRFAVVASAAALLVFIIATLPQLWPHGLDGHCVAHKRGRLADGSTNDNCSDGSAMHLGVAALGVGALLALAAVGNAAAPSALHARALKVQAVIIGEVVISYALMAAGQSAPVCRNSSYGDPPAGRIETGHPPCGQRYLLRNACWWACHVAFLSLAAYVMRMRRSVLAGVVAAHSFNMVTGVAMSLHALVGMKWIYAHGTTILVCTAIYAQQSWRLVRALHHQREVESAAADRQKADQADDYASSSASFGAELHHDAVMRQTSASSQAASPRLAAFVGSCAVFILALRFLAGALHLYTPSDKRLLLAGMIDAAIYVVAPLAIVSGEVLSDARRMTARLAAAEARDRAKRDVLRFMSHELRVPLNGIVVGLDLLSSTSSSSNGSQSSATASAMRDEDLESERVLQDMKMAAAAMSALMTDFLAIESADVSGVHMSLHQPSPPASAVDQMMRPYYSLSCPSPSPCRLALCAYARSESTCGQCYRALRHLLRWELGLAGCS